jgi:tetratricopeptide (TPR) repeat protein
LAKKASREFEKALEKDPNSAKSHYNLGVLYEQQGQRALAIDAYKEALRLNPDFREAHFNLALAYYEDGQKDLAQAQARNLQALDPSLARELAGHLKD